MNNIESLYPPLKRSQVLVGALVHWALFVDLLQIVLQKVFLPVRIKHILFKYSHLTPWKYPHYYKQELLKSNEEQSDIHRLKALHVCLVQILTIK